MILRYNLDNQQFTIKHDLYFYKLFRYMAITSFIVSPADASGVGTILALTGLHNEQKGILHCCCLRNSHVGNSDNFKELGLSNFKLIP